MNIEYNKLPNLELIEYMFREAIRPYSYKYENEDLNMMVFQEVWDSTALGFAGVGGCAMTEAYTTVVYSNDRKFAGVYWNGKLGYLLEDPNELFFQDIRKQMTVRVTEKGKYLPAK